MCPPTDPHRFRASYLLEYPRKNTSVMLYPKINAARMQAIKAKCDRAPIGEKRTVALMHYHAAEAASIAHDNLKLNKELDAARRVLG